MFTALIVLFFIIGLIAGSFLNVLIIRMDDLKSVFLSRSQCPNCKKILKWYDLIPLLSFVLLKTKCRYCGKPISWQYPAVEVGTAILFAFLYMLFGFSWSLFFYVIVFSLLTVILVYDIKTQMIPDLFAWIALVVSLLGGWYFGGFGLINMVYGALICGIAIAFLVYVSREKWMGAGDIKVAMTLGALIGYPVAIFSLFLAFLLGSVVGIIYIITAKKTLKEALPFSPFLIFSTLVSLYVGTFVTAWYLNLYIINY